MMSPSARARPAMMSPSSSELAGENDTSYAEPITFWNTHVVRGTWKSLVTTRSDVHPFGSRKRRSTKYALPMVSRDSSSVSITRRGRPSDAA